MANVPAPATGRDSVARQQDHQVFRMVLSAETGLTAFAGGGQASATPLQWGANRVTTVATGGDSVLLPPAVQGLCVVVCNAAAANSMNVFPRSGESINALAADAAFAMASNKAALFVCMATGVWNSILTA